MENNYIITLPYPKIPNELLLPSEEILALPEVVFKNRVGFRTDAGKKTVFWRRVNPELKEWLKNNIDYPFSAYYHVHTDLLKSHTDFRRTAINYFVDLGGDDVYTEYYSRELFETDEKVKNLANLRQSVGMETTVKEENRYEQIRVLYREKIPLHTWKQYDTTIPHGTNSDSGHLDRPRIFVSVVPNSELPIPPNPIIAENVLEWRDTW